MNTLVDLLNTGLAQRVGWALVLTGQKLAHAGMIHLSGLRALQELSLDSVPLTDDGLAHLQELTDLNLKVVRLHGSAFRFQSLKSPIGCTDSLPGV